MKKTGFCENCFHMFLLHTKIKIDIQNDVLIFLEECDYSAMWNLSDNDRIQHMEQLAILSQKLHLWKIPKPFLVRILKITKGLINLFSNLEKIPDLVCALQIR